MLSEAAQAGEPWLLLEDDATLAAPPPRPQERPAAQLSPDERILKCASEFKAPGADSNGSGASGASVLKRAGMM